jgi:2-oxoglutarate ferredoxin oxidoreductase subunit alpha
MSIHESGGFVHQAEDEIAAIGFAIGASYAGKTACTITSGPGIALKTELIALAVMAEVPLVIVDVQRGGPSTGLPTKVEQGDLLADLYGEPGDAPKPVLAAATIEECLHLHRHGAKAGRGLPHPGGAADRRQPGHRRAALFRARTRSPTGSPRRSTNPTWDEDVPPSTGTRRPVSPRGPSPAEGRRVRPHRPGPHNRSKVAYDSDSNQTGSRCAAASSPPCSTLKPPAVHGDDGDLLVVGWGSTLGAIEEAVERARAEGLRVSSLHLRFLSPLEPGLKEIFKRFGKVMTVEINYSDDPNDPRVDRRDPPLLRSSRCCCAPTP